MTHRHAAPQEGVSTNLQNKLRSTEDKPSHREQRKMKEGDIKDFLFRKGSAPKHLQETGTTEGEEEKCQLA